MRPPIMSLGGSVVDVGCTNKASWAIHGRPQHRIDIRPCASCWSGTGRPISFEEAESLVRKISEISREFQKNASCTINRYEAFTQSCGYHLMYASCTPAKNDPGLVRDFFVNKTNGDVFVNGSAESPIQEPALRLAQRRLLVKADISPATERSARETTKEGCLAY